MQSGRIYVFITPFLAITAKTVTIGVWQGVATGSLKFHLSRPCPTLLRPGGGPPLKWPYRAGGLRLSSSLLETPRHTPRAVTSTVKPVSSVGGEMENHI
jgi:hypothetical protein